MGLSLWHFVEEVEHRSSALLIYTRLSTIRGIACG
jgi:predicted metal-dependent hydrolase